MDIFTKIKIGIYAIVIGSLALSISTNKRLSSKLDYAVKETAYYMDRNSDKIGEIAALEVNAARLRHSNDYLVRRADSLANELKIKVNKPGSVISYVEVEVLVTDTIPIIIRDTIRPCDFKVELNPNNLTRFSVEYKNDTLYHEAKINNQQTLFVYPHRAYSNEYKTFIARLLRLDFKKRDMTKYQVHNTNDLIKILDSSVILVKD